MISIAIGVLWFLIGLIILCGIIYLAIWVIESFVMAIPEQIKKGVWVVVLLLALIALLSLLATGGLGSLKPPFRTGEPIGTPPSVSALATADLYRLLR